MQVILLSDVYKHGVAGEVVNVADGFARNWLIPKKLAVKATPGALKQAENLRSQASMRKAALDNRLNDLARQIDGVELVFGRRASPTGKLFGSVTTSEIAEALNKKTGIDINRRRISQTALREVGTHSVPVRLGTEIAPELRVIIVREEEYASFLKQREAPQNADEAAAPAAEGVVETVQEAVEPAAEAAASAESGAVEAVRAAVVDDPAEDEPQNAAE
jgi:large subunit ribosomal protein L9